MAELKTKHEEISNEDITDFKSKYMELALKQAQIGKDSNEVPVGCVIIENNEKVIASAHNQTNITKNATKHCEIICMEYLAKHNIYELSNCYLYVTVEPCVMCASALKITNIKKVFYGCSNTKFGGNGSVYSLNIKDTLGFPLECFSFSYPSIKIGGKFEELAINLLKSFYESGNDLCPPEKRARKRIKLNINDDQDIDIDIDIDIETKQINTIHNEMIQ